VDLVGREPVLPSGVELVDLDVLDAVRIEAGVPTLGAELTERTIPAEIDGLVDKTVSFTKGCYTGQELVARIDSRGNRVPRHLRGVLLSEPVAAGSRLELDGKEVGWLTSVGMSPSLGVVGLAYVARTVKMPAVVQVQVEGESEGGTGVGGSRAKTTADVRQLPLSILSSGDPDTR
jgi:folate-binding protein YgfZ